jgi:D-alanyl-D-alanine dipeptidase
MPDNLSRHSGMVRKHQTRNLEIPGSMLRIAPE